MIRTCSAKDPHQAVAGTEVRSPRVHPGYPCRCPARLSAPMRSAANRRRFIRYGHFIENYSINIHVDMFENMTAIVERKQRSHGLAQGSRYWLHLSQFKDFRSL